MRKATTKTEEKKETNTKTVQLPSEPDPTSVDERQAKELARSQILRVAIDTTYDLQKLRIATGNRIIQPFLKDNIIEDDSEKKKIIVQLVSEHDMVLNAYKEKFNSKGRISKAIDSLQDELKRIVYPTHYQLIDVYMNMLKQEQESVKIVASVVNAHPMWDHFFKDITGCGPMMAAVCISRLDPYKARHAGSFHRYAGLDVVFENAETRRLAELIDPDLNPTEAAEQGIFPYDVDSVPLAKHVYIEWDDGRIPFDMNVIDATANDNEIIIETPGVKFSLPMVEKDKIIRPNKANGLEEPKLIPGAKIIDFEIVDLEEVQMTPNGRYVGRSMRHTVKVTYIDKNGDEKQRNSISYNAFLKSKLMGVLADSFIKNPGCHYEQIYRGYRHRIDMMPAHYGKTDAHKHMMAKRYTIKMFLNDMWKSWRGLEGLPIGDPYPVAKLGMNPHGFNY